MNHTIAQSNPANLIAEAISPTEARTNLIKLKTGLYKAVIASDLGMVETVRAELHENEIVFRVRLSEPSNTYQKIIGRL